MGRDDPPPPAPVVALGDLSVLQRRLHACPTVGELFACAVEEACRSCGFDRGVILSVQGGRLTTGGMDVVSGPGSDALRRQVLADPIQLRAGTEEAELIRQAQGGRRARSSAASVVKEALSLEHHAMGAVAPDLRALAVLVLDRPDHSVTAGERGAVVLFAHLLGFAVERLVLRARMHELSAELRHLTASAHALMHEALETPIVLPSDSGQGPAFPYALIAPPMPDRLRALLSDREVDVLRLMVEGLSNRMIGQQLNLSAETIKAHVGRILPKLGAANRVEAVVRYVSLTRNGPA